MVNDQISLKTNISFTIHIQDSKTGIHDYLLIVKYFLISTHFYFRHRRVDEDSMTLGSKCCFTFLMLITQILLHGVVGLVLYWVWMFHKGDDPSKIYLV